MPDIEIATSEWKSLTTGLPKGRRILAVGDSHGKSPQLAALVDRLEAGLHAGENSLLVFTGDFVDRGEDSIGCLDIAIEARSRAFSEVVYLMGNHEQMLLRTIRGDKDAFILYCVNGASATLNQLNPPYSLNVSPEILGRTLASDLGQERMQFLTQLSSHYREAFLLFVHAGTDPRNSLEAHLARPWDELDDDHWCWIRYPFLILPVHLPDLTVVHGHTPVRIGKPESDDLIEPHLWYEGKINIDGGSFRSGCVTGAEFVAGQYRILVAYE